MKSGAASSGPSYKAGSTDTRAVLVLREALPRELCIGRSEAPHQSGSHPSHNGQATPEAAKNKSVLWPHAASTAWSGSMRTISALGRAATVAALVSGCSAAQVTQPLPAGPDTYTVSARTSRGGPASARDAAISAANQHCARLSKQLLVMSSSANTVPNENNPGLNENESVVDVTFRCQLAIH